MSERKAALVTGAGRGIGRGIAMALANNQWGVVINYRSNEKKAFQTAHLIKDSGGTCIVLKADVSRLSEHRRLIEETVRHFGRLDLLVNNAGIAPRQRRDILETTANSYDKVMTVNLKGPFFLTQLVARKMIDLVEAGTVEAPKIINIGSISAYVSSPNRSEYCISKAGMSMMTMLYADRLAEHGIQVFEIRPGIIDTDMTSAAKEKYDRLIGEGLTSIRRWGTAEDVAGAVVAVVQGYLPFSTGEIINVDGGFHLRRL
ncbi:3-ketoacyl-ACP reductase [candidate division KSB1 bacterium]|nr:3-ketoacyl-ACP reductase [candidate division KSB1 bacterium]NIV70791.1 3-ketoacyl-ACP reductase [Phycisphaerae bacterium]NIR72909.1 3-ketoacyl-ACP reductase [candidate division KSB1 bacterium]NIT73707.1 3-ketoacyl-ACP reductase [candidate division KSB1 bacterium]NIU27579.1 3-ketoacyl-ACP reductase [candidate division KSB1 bacterium]